MKNDCEGWTGDMVAAPGLDVDSSTRPHDNLDECVNTLMFED